MIRTRSVDNLENSGSETGLSYDRCGDFLLVACVYMQLHPSIAPFPRRSLLYRLLPSCTVRIFSRIDHERRCARQRVPVARGIGLDIAYPSILYEKFRVIFVRLRVIPI